MLIWCNIPSHLIADQAADLAQMFDQFYLIKFGSLVERTICISFKLNVSIGCHTVKYTVSSNDPWLKNGGKKELKNEHMVFDNEMEI